MEARAYKDKKGRILFVRMFEGSDQAGSPLYGTHYRHPKTGALCPLVNKEMPRVHPVGAAQANLDAYALQKEYETVEPVADLENTPRDGSGAGGGTTAEEPGAAVAPGAVPPSLWEDGKELRLMKLREDLQGLVEEEMSYKERASADASHWRSLLKDVDERKSDTLAEIHQEERIDPNALPFEGPAETKQAEEETKGPSGEEPMMVACEECSGAGTVNGEECKGCMGTGRVIPQPQEEPQPEQGARPEPWANCLNCGHPAAAHFYADGQHRACVISMAIGHPSHQHSKVCGCANFEQGEAETPEEAADET